jgi:alkylhydroperoxidase family enzyme
MSVVHPVPADRAPKELHEIYEGLTKKFGKMPNFFGLMAHRPKVLALFLPFYSAVTAEGTLDPKLKELAYLKTSMVNGCEY